MKAIASFFHLRRHRPSWVGGLVAASGLALAAAAATSGCGASIQAVYEGDVRFEHCMALDAQPEVLPSIQRACWMEWIAFYTYGQTRDRVMHAQLRVDQLSDLSGGADAASEPGAAGTRPAGQHDVACQGTCRAVREDCIGDCGDLVRCRKECSVSFKSCLRSCG